MERGNLPIRCKGRTRKWRTHEGESTDAERRGGSLGIPTVGDRIAQTVVKMVLEPIVEPHFHEDSYGYRPGKSAHDAIGVARKRCWRADWVIDLAIKGFFDNPWIRLYIARRDPNLFVHWQLGVRPAAGAGGAG